MVAEVGRGRDAVQQVVVVERFVQAHRDGLEVPAGEAAVGGEAFGQDQQIPLLQRQAIVVAGEEPPDIGHPVLLGRHGAAVCVGEELPGDIDRPPGRRTPPRAA